MYFTPGSNPNELGDFDIVEHQGKLHLFYLKVYNHDSFGHLVSTDGINWQPLPDAIRAGDPGSFDDDQLWTMGVFRKGDTWFMLYTALQNDGRMQVVGLATSPDLLHWTKHDKNPVIAADLRWYEATQTGNFRVDWRDPHVIERDGVLHGFICARENHGPLNHRGCAGYFTSTNGYDWAVQPPACQPGNCYDYECPSVFELDGRYYMVAIHGGHDRTTWRVADQVQGPYQRLGDDSLLPGLNMSVRPCFWRGRVHLFHWNRGLRDWGTQHGGYYVLSSPKIASTDERGQLMVQSFDWSGHHVAAPVTVDPQTPGRASSGQWAWQGERLMGDCAGTGAWLTDQIWRDFEMTAELQCDPDQPPAEFGMLLRSDETGDCAMYVRCIVSRSAVELVKQVYNRINGPESLYRGRAVEQRFHIAPEADGRYHLRLIAFGPNIEFNVNGRLVLSQLRLPRREGHAGVFLEDGKAEFRNITITPLHEPRTNWDH